MEQFKKSNVLKFHFITGTVLLIVLYNFCLAMLFEPGSDWEHNKSAFNPAKQADAIIFAFGWSLGSFGYFVLLAILGLVYVFLFWLIKKIFRRNNAI